MKMKRTMFVDSSGEVHWRMLPKGSKKAIKKYYWEKKTAKSKSKNTSGR